MKIDLNNNKFEFREPEQVKFLLNTFNHPPAITIFPLDEKRPIVAVGVLLDPHANQWLVFAYTEIHQEINSVRPRFMIAWVDYENEEANTEFHRILIKAAEKGPFLQMNVPRWVFDKSQPELEQPQPTNKTQVLIDAVFDRISPVMEQIFFAIGQENEDKHRVSMMEAQTERLSQLRTLLHMLCLQQFEGMEYNDLRFLVREQMIATLKTMMNK